MGKGVTYSSSKSKRSTGLSSTRMTSRQTGSKMSGAKGLTNGGGKHKTLYNTSRALGADCPTMGPNFKQGPCHISKKGY